MGLLLRILALVFRGIVSIRGWLYDSGVIRSYSSSLPVVSIGNVTTGGNGKTPLCLALALELRNRGYFPAILSRGYGGRIRKPHRVSHSDSCLDVGDEAVLMVESGIPVFIATKRVAGIKLIEREGEFNVVILDDGFQHRALARCMDIVSVFVGSSKAVDEFVAGKLLPAGMFREVRDKALPRAQAVVLSYRAVRESGQGEPEEQRVRELLPRDAVVYRSFLSASGVVSLYGNREIGPQKVCAVAAIANPEGFFSSLESLGFHLVDRVVYRDHHQFSEAEIRSLLTMHPGLLCVCTAKDAVKLREFPSDIRERFAVLSVAAHIIPSDSFFAQVERAIQKHQNSIPNERWLSS